MRKRFCHANSRPSGPEIQKEGKNMGNLEQMVFT